MLSLCLVLALLWTPGGLLTSPGGPAPAASASPVLLSQYGGAALGVAYGANYIYAGMGPRLVIYDALNLSQIKQVGISTLLPGVVQDVQVVLTTFRAYVTLGEGGLAVFNILNKTAPVLLGTYDTPGFARGLWINGNYAYVADGDNGLVVLNISNPYDIFQAAYYDTPGTARMVVISTTNRTFVADGAGGLLVLEVTPTAGEIVPKASWLPPSGYSESVVVGGDSDTIVYLALGEAGIRSLKVSQNYVVFWEEEDGFAVNNTPGYAQDILLDGNYLYVADGQGGMSVITKEISELLEMGTYDSPGSADKLALLPTESGCFVFLADTSSTQVVSALDLAFPTRNGLPQNSPAIPTRLAVSGDYAYLADPLQGLQIINTANPSQPALSGTVDTPGVTYDVAVRESTAYVADGKAGLQLFDIANPSLPVKTGEVNTPGDAVGVALANDAAYLADSDNGLVGVTFTETITGTVVVSGTYDTDGTALDVAVAGGYAYVADGFSGLVIVNRLPVEGMTRAGGFDTPGKASALALDGERLYLADGPSGLRIFNVGNPALPLQLGVYDTLGEAVDVAVVGNMVYLAEKDAGVHMLDVSDPTEPRQVFFYATTGSAKGVAANSRYVYVGDEPGGLLIFSAPPSSYFLRLPLVMR